MMSLLDKNFQVNIYIDPPNCQIINQLIVKSALIFAKKKYWKCITSNQAKENTGLLDFGERWSLCKI